MRLKDDHRGLVKRFVTLVGLLVSVSVLAVLQAPPMLLAIVALAWLALFFYLERKSSAYAPASMIDRIITVSLALAGYSIGLFIPVDGLNYFPEGLGLSLLCFLGVGLIEMPLLKKILSPTSAVSILNRHRFPFFSLGLALSVVLRSS